MTRRTALRGAAWTAPAITIAVASPNVAATSHTGPEPTTFTASAPQSVSLGSVAGEVTWTFTIKNTGHAAITSLSAVFTGDVNPTVKTVTCIVDGSGPPQTWNGTGNTRTFGALAAGASLSVTVTMMRGNSGLNKVAAANITSVPAASAVVTHTSPSLPR